MIKALITKTGLDTGLPKYKQHKTLVATTHGYMNSIIHDLVDIIPDHVITSLLNATTGFLTVYPYQLYDLAFEANIGTQLANMTKAVDGWQVRSFDTSNLIVSMAALIHKVGKGRKEAELLKASCHPGMVILQFIKLMLEVDTAYDPDSRLKDMVKVWIGLHDYDTTDYNAATPSMILCTPSSRSWPLQPTVNASLILLRPRCQPARLLVSTPHPHVHAPQPLIAALP